MPHKDCKFSLVIKNQEQKLIKDSTELTYNRLIHLINMIKSDLAVHKLSKLAIHKIIIKLISSHTKYANGTVVFNFYP